MQAIKRSLAGGITAIVLVELLFWVVSNGKTELIGQTFQALQNMFH